MLSKDPAAEGVRFDEGRRVPWPLNAGTQAAPACRSLVQSCWAEWQHRHSYGHIGSRLVGVTWFPEASRNPLRNPADRPRPGDPAAPLPGRPPPRAATTSHTPLTLFPDFLLID